MPGPGARVSSTLPGRRARAALLRASLGLASLGLASLGLAGWSASIAAQQTERLGAILQGLDKTTARVSTIEAPIDAIARFGTLEIVARACHKKPPTETPESTAFLEIVDVRPDSPAIQVFTGWMFASSPAVSAMEHPVYDVWVVDCRMIAPPAEPAATGTEAAVETGNSEDLGAPLKAD